MICQHKPKLLISHLTLGLRSPFSNDSWNYIHWRFKPFSNFWQSKCLPLILGPRTAWPRFAKKPSTLLPQVLSFGTAFTPGYWTFPQRNVDFFFHYRSPVPFGHADRKTAPCFVQGSEKSKQSSFLPLSWTFIFVLCSQFTNIWAQPSMSDFHCSPLRNQDIFEELELSAFFNVWQKLANDIIWDFTEMPSTTV